MKKSVREDFLSWEWRMERSVQPNNPYCGRPPRRSRQLFNHEFSSCSILLLNSREEKVGMDEWKMPHSLIEDVCLPSPRFPRTPNFRWWRRTGEWSICSLWCSARFAFSSLLIEVIFSSGRTAASKKRTTLSVPNNRSSHNRTWWNQLNKKHHG